MTFELYKDKSDISQPQSDSFLNKFTSSFIRQKIPKTYCTPTRIHSRSYPNPFFVQMFE